MKWFSKRTKPSAMEPALRPDGRSWDISKWTWDDLPQSLKDAYSRSDWDTFVAEIKVEAAKERLAMQPPPDWVEPSMTLEEADADPFGEDAADFMRRHGLDRITRGQYLAGRSGPWPQSWDAEAEATLPLKLQDDYMWIPPELRGRSRRRRKRKVRE